MILPDADQTMYDVHEQGRSLHGIGILRIVIDVERMSTYTWLTLKVLYMTGCDIEMGEQAQSGGSACLPKQVQYCAYNGLNSMVTLT